jgi:hypothetical protein
MCQETTDLEKAFGEGRGERCVVWGAFTGRFVFIFFRKE